MSFLETILLLKASSYAMLCCLKEEFLREFLRFISRLKFYPAGDLPTYILLLKL